MSARDERYLKVYLGESAALVVSADPCVRERVRAALTELGVAPTRLQSASGYGRAMEIVRERPPRVVVCDDLDLFRTLRETRDERASADTLWILITADNSRANIARAAEEEVDGFCFVPFRDSRLRARIVSIAMDKLFPTDYVRLIDEGRAFLRDADVENAVRRFKEAMDLVAEPSLACYYLGQAYALMESSEDAAAQYELGMRHNDLHLKCMLALFELLLGEGREAQAYAVARRLFRIFPLQAERFPTVVSLAVRTRNYADIRGYHASTSGQPELPIESGKVLSAALAVAGRHYLMNRAIDDAVDAFARLAALVPPAPAHTYVYAIESLEKYGEEAAASAFLRSVPQACRESERFLALLKNSASTVRPVS